LLGLSLPFSAFAALEVTFQNSPLFANTNVLPGDAVTRTVTVSNTGTEPEEIIFSLENTFSDGLADVMEIAVTSGASVYADATFSTLFDWGEVALGTLPAASSKTYNFSAFLSPDIGNPYQLTEMGFDLVIGFSGGETITDTPPTGGTSSGGRRSFSLFNETVVVVDNTKANLTWNTNRLATNYAVCGNDNDGPFVLDPADDLFGYRFASTEGTDLARSHSVLFTDLAIGTYSCRVASRENTTDAFTVSGVLRFEILPTGEVAGAADSRPLTQGNIFQPTAYVAGASTSGKGANMTYDEFRTELDAMKAARAAEETRTGTTTATAQPISELPKTPDPDTLATKTIPWWFIILLGIIAIGTAWWLTGSRRR
jgi:hypothetical protein